MTDYRKHAHPLEHVRVADCMHRGIISCRSDAPVEEVARIMAAHKVHAVAVTGTGNRPIGVVSDLDMVAAAARGEEITALQVAATEPLSVSAAEPLHRAAQLMAEHGTAHLVVVDASSGYPSGVLSTLDVAAAVAGQAAT